MSRGARDHAAPRVERPQPHASYRDILEVTADGVVVLDEQGTVLFANPAAGTILGRDLASLPGLSFGLPLVRSDHLAELDVSLPGGRTVVVEMYVAPLRWRGKAAHAVTLRDVTERAVAARRLRESEDRYALSALAVNDGLWDWDRATGLVHVSARLQEILGHEPGERLLPPQALLDLVHPDDVPGLALAAQLHEEGQAPRVVRELRVRRLDGSWLWVLERAIAVREEGEIKHVAGSLTDISERKDAEDALRSRALHDPLTGLANRALLLDHLQGVIDRVARSRGDGFALVFLDLDNFKPINDTFGHAAGDEVLVEVASRLPHCVRATDTVGRLGGDEFVILLEAPADTETVLGTVRRIQGALRRPVHCAGSETTISASIGVLLNGEDLTSPEAALAGADLAMYQAKARGPGSFHLVSAQRDTWSHEQRRSVAELRNALAHGDLFPRYQPVVDLADGRVLAFDALLRWRVDEQVVLDAGDFLGVAERSGLIVPAGWQTLAAACRQAHLWREAHFPVRVSVKLAERQAVDPSLVGRVESTLAESGVDGEALSLEVRERTASSSEEVVERLARCRDKGVDIVVSDLGIGSFSLKTLGRLPLTGVKVDRSLVSQLDRDGDVVRVLVGMSRGLELDVVAVGVETPRQRERLRDLGCRAAAGYLFQPALDEVAATELLHHQERDVKDD